MGYDGRLSYTDTSLKITVGTAGLTSFNVTVSTTAGSGSVAVAASSVHGQLRRRYYGMRRRSLVKGTYDCGQVLVSVETSVCKNTRHIPDDCNLNKLVTAVRASCQAN